MNRLQRKLMPMQNTLSSPCRVPSSTWCFHLRHLPPPVNTPLKNNPENHGREAELTQRQSQSSSPHWSSSAGHEG
ncbi:hypothetical protein DPEC_G00136840 [Dallia pectoralis]|uniref:Uncharacterized protein n=1 Tax=Dallia pectoralis TaxID=75939 RepID=A0ACC2GLT4_DALPE|nr:hypothetical protein DPEC_G00136840 [Dallia pectoralis]